eukprot:jgi/Tetstr1/442415/TSEL_030539.t1
MPTNGLRPQRREDQAFPEDTTTARMEIDSPEEQQDAGAVTFLAALRGGRRLSHLLLTGLPAGTDDAPHVALLFGDLVAQHQAMDKESRSRTVTNLIRTLSPKIGVQILPADHTTNPSHAKRRQTNGDTGGLREMWKACRSADSVRLELLDPEAARLLHDVCRDAVLALPFGDQSQGRAVIQVAVEHSEDREDQPTTPLPRVLPPALSKQFFRCALTAKAICTAPLANLELPTVEQLAEAIAATISHRTNTPPELHHAQWLTYTMTTAGVEMHHYHTEPTLLRVGDNNLCAISLGQEDEEFADTLRLAVALTSPVALLRAMRLRWIVIYLTESEPNRTTSSSDPSSTDRTPATAPAATATNGAHADDEEELELNYEEDDSAMEVDTTKGEAAETPATELLAQSYPVSKPTIAANLASLTAESHQLSKPQRISIQLEHHPSQPTPASKGKTATAVQLKKKQPRGRSRSDGATRNRSRSKPRLSGTRGSDNDWETDDEADQPANSSH